MVSWPLDAGVGTASRCDREWFEPAPVDQRARLSGSTSDVVDGARRLLFERLPRPKNRPGKPDRPFEVVGEVSARYGEVARDSGGVVTAAANSC